jgi:hypothetical protein
MTSSQYKEVIIPIEFKNNCKNFISLIKHHFPEYNAILAKWWKDPSDFSHLSSEEEKINKYNLSESTSLKLLFSFMNKNYSPIILDILNKNEFLFSSSIFLLPNIDFKIVWNKNVSDDIKYELWKHLQLISYTVIENMTDKKQLNNFLKWVEQDLKHKDLFTHLFESCKNKMESNQDDKSPEKMLEQISELLNGKLGKLTMEIMDLLIAYLKEEGISIEVQNPNIENIMKIIMQNQSKIMNIIEKLFVDIEKKMNEGDISKEDLFVELKNWIQKLSQMEEFKKFGFDKIFDLILNTNDPTILLNIFKQFTSSSSPPPPTQKKSKLKKNKKQKQKWEEKCKAKLIEKQLQSFLSNLQQPL